MDSFKESSLESRLAAMEQYQSALPGSLGERYLRWRGIAFEVARNLGIGFAADGRWAHVDPRTGRPLRQWKHGRVVFPHTDPEGRLVNLYGRAVGGDSVPKQVRHDHLTGSKGYFNGGAICRGTGPLYVCEGPFDAAALMTAGIPRVLAIFGVNGWRWDWMRSVREIVFAFDADDAGERWRAFAQEAILRGKKVSFLPPSALGGAKDINEAWVKGTLAL